MKAFRYRLPLVKPIELAGQTHSVREGLLLQADAGWGEAETLPGFSHESLDDVIAAWKAGPPFSCRSLQFAYDAAREPTTSVTVPVNALLMGSCDEIIGQVKQLVHSACRAVKLKVGRGRKIEQDIDLVRRVRRILQPHQHLRLDANRAWDLPTAIAFGQGLAGCSVEYIEEPLHDPTELDEFYRETQLPYALDESVHECGEANILGTLANAAALICKPTLVGGRVRLQQLATMGSRLVISASFESGVGIARLAQWSHEFAPHVPVGLDTYSWLSEDVLTRRLQIVDWSLTVPSDLEVDFSRLVEVKR